MQPLPPGRWSLSVADKNPPKVGLVGTMVGVSHTDTFVGRTQHRFNFQNNQTVPVLRNTKFNPISALRRNGVVMSTYLTIIALLLLVLSPLVIPVVITVSHAVGSLPKNFRRIGWARGLQFRPAV